ncbi:MAG: hypothetical protein L6R42_007964, partial [Xanthoria sp. 1 TBL-2021]
ISKTDLQVPQEIACRKRLDHAVGPGISPYALFHAHTLALLVGDHHPNRGCADDDTLDQTDDVDIPVDPASERKRRVDGREEAAGEEWGDVGADDVVRQSSEEEFVDVDG